MDLRRTEKNKINQTIRETERIIVREQATVLRFKKSEGDNRVAMSKRNTNIEVFENKLVYLQSRLTILASGDLDEELQVASQKIQDEIQKKNDETMKKRAALTVVQKPQQKRQPFKKNNNFSRQTQSTGPPTTRFDRSYTHFCKACDSVPNYILKNLSTMPGNKGYIWKSVYCYGELPVEKGQPSVMFERKNRDTLLIHEWSPTEYKRFEKDGKNRKKLVHQELRKKRDNGVNLLDYVKK